MPRHPPLVTRLSRLRVRPIGAQHLEARAVLGLVDVALGEALGERGLGAGTAGPRRAVALGAAVRPGAAAPAGDAGR